MIGDLCLSANAVAARILAEKHRLHAEARAARLRAPKVILSLRQDGALVDCVADAAEAAGLTLDQFIDRVLRAAIRSLEPVALPAVQPNPIFPRSCQPSAPLTIEASAA